MKRSSIRSGGSALGLGLGHGFALALALCLASPALASPALAAGPDFSWNGDLAPGKSIHIYDINGHVTATRASSRQATVTAVKRGHESNFDRVRVEMVPTSDGISVCALFPLKHGKEMTCQNGHLHSDGETEDVKVQVDFTIQVPDGVKLEVSNVNGGIDAMDLASPLELKTVNGGINASSSDLVEAETVN